MDALAHAASLNPLDFRLKISQIPSSRRLSGRASLRLGARIPRPRAAWHRRRHRQGGYTALRRVAIDPLLTVSASFALSRPGSPAPSSTLTASATRSSAPLFRPSAVRSLSRSCSPMAASSIPLRSVPRTSLQRRPAIEVVLIDRKDLPSAGAGETGIVALAPAVANALFAATGSAFPYCRWRRARPPRRARAAPQLTHLRIRSPAAEWSATGTPHPDSPERPSPHLHAQPRRLADAQQNLTATFKAVCRQCMLWLAKIPICRRMK